MRTILGFDGIAPTILTGTYPDTHGVWTQYKYSSQTSPFAYIMFSILEYGYKAVFCEETYTETERTKKVEKEEEYKRKVVTGIYQALSYTKAPLPIRLFYIALPFLSVLILIMDQKGYYWTKGILLGYLRTW